MKKHMRILLFLGIISLSLWLGLTREIPYSELQGFCQFFRVFMFVLAMIYIYSFVRIILRIRQLSNE